MTEEIKSNFIAILNEELIPAMGCTEPISLAYAAAVAKKTLGKMPESAEVTVSGNIIKNVKSVIVPHTNGLKGIETAIAAGFVFGNADKQLEVLSEATAENIQALSKYLEKNCIKVSQSQSDRLFEIIVTVYSGSHSAMVEITDGHTNIATIKYDGKVIFEDRKVCEKAAQADRGLLSVERIVDFAENVDIGLIRGLLDRQIKYNVAISEEGLRGNYGACIGKILLKTNGDGVINRAKAYAAAGSDARMNGCELPVVINSGSGNQGITSSLPVIVYARELDVDEETLYRALLVSNLVTIHLRSGIGCLSAYCGAISAGVGAAAGITYLFGGRFNQIAHTIVNAIAINSGIVCDGAKASCAAKIASAVEAGILGMNMYMHGSQFYSGDGIVSEDIEKTIENVSELAREGMRETDKEILKIMMRCK